MVDLSYMAQHRLETYKDWPDNHISLIMSAQPSATGDFHYARRRTKHEGVHCLDPLEVGVAQMPRLLSRKLQLH